MALKSIDVHTKTDKKKAEKDLATSQTKLEQALLDLTLKDSTLEDEKRKTAECEDGLEAEKMAASHHAAELEKRVTELEDDIKVFWASIEGEITTLKIDYKAKKCAIIKEYKKSPQYRRSWRKEVLPYYTQGKSHIFHMAVASGVQLPQLQEWNMTSPYDTISRGMHRVVPFLAEEVELIKSDDPTWSPPTPIHENVMYLTHVVEKGSSVKRLEQGWEITDVSSAESSDDEDEDVAVEGATTS